MRTRKIFTTICSAVMLASLFGVAAKHNVSQKAEAAADTKWRIAGTMNGWSANSDNPAYNFTFNSVTGFHELTISMVVEDEFKFTQGGSWDNSIGPPAGWGHSGDFQNEFFKEWGNDHNFRCFITGTYLLKLTEGASSVNHFTFSPVTSAETVTISYYNGTELLTTVDLDKNLPYNPIHIDVAGYRLEGWYTDSAFTTKFVKGTPIAVNTDLYGKYILGQVEYIYATIEPSWTTVAAYMWSDELGNYNSSTGWPGVAMTKVTGTTNLYCYQLPLEANFDRLIFNNNNNGEQTENIIPDYPYDDTVIFNVSNSKNASARNLHSSYSIVNNKVILEGETITSNVTGPSGQAFNYTGNAAAASAAYYIHLSAGAVIAEPVTDSATKVTLIKNYIITNAGCSTTADEIEKYYDLFNTLTADEKQAEGMDAVIERLEYIAFITAHRELSQGQEANRIYAILSENNTSIWIIVGALITFSSIAGYFFMKRKIA